MTERTCAYPGCEKPFNCKGYCRGHYHQLKRGTPLRPLGFKAPRGASAAQRLALRTAVLPNGCWEYTGARDENGYGTVAHDGRTWLAHRLAFVAHMGEIPPGEVVRHRCDNPPCVNPAHLAIGTQADNVADAISRDRFARGENVSTHKLTDADCDAIRDAYAEGVSMAVLAARFPQVKRHHVYRVAVGERRSKPTNGRPVAA